VSLVGAPADGSSGSARTDRRGEFRVSALPDGDQQVVASHPLLGSSSVATVRIYRGTTARGVRLRFDHDLAGATPQQAPASVALVDRGGRVEVSGVASDSAPSRAGLQPGDQVLTVQGRGVSSAAQALADLAGPSGDEVMLEVMRDGARRTVRWVRDPAR